MDAGYIVGEGAINHGGPPREFFWLLAKEASERHFYGALTCKFFSNVIDLQVSYIVHRILMQMTSINFDPCRIVYFFILDSMQLCL